MAVGPHLGKWEPLGKYQIMWWLKPLTAHQSLYHRAASPGWWQKWCFGMYLFLFKDVLLLTFKVHQVSCVDGAATSQVMLVHAEMSALVGMTLPRRSDFSRLSSLPSAIGVHSFLCSGVLLWNWCHCWQFHTRSNRDICQRWGLSSADSKSMASSQFWQSRAIKATEDKVYIMHVQQLCC